MLKELHDLIPRKKRGVETILNNYTSNGRVINEQTQCSKSACVENSVHVGYLQTVSKIIVLEVDVDKNGKNTDAEDFFFPAVMVICGMLYKLKARLMSTTFDGTHFWCYVHRNKPTPGFYMYNDLLNGWTGS
jgi:hypothetical protein